VSNVSISPGAPTTMSESVYENLRAEILAGTLPPLQKLRAEELAARLGTSASPMREALSRLAGEGLVVGKGQRGYWVAPISVKEFNEITQLRLLIEARALRDSIEAGDMDWEGRVVAAYHRLSRIEMTLDTHHASNAREWERENRRYHTELISACPSDWLKRLTSTLYDHSERYRCLVVATKPIPAAVTSSEHKNILDAALARDVERATMTLSLHILNAARNTEAFLASLEASPQENV
jgi:GntR family carbon starvation induced transcriptional regulator